MSEPSVEIIHGIGDHLVVVDKGHGVHHIVCASCSHDYGPKTLDPKLNSVVRQVPITASSRLNEYGAVDELVVREFYCPTCGTMIAANVQRPHDPVLIETELI